MNAIKFFDEIDDERLLVGGKGYSLARTSQAGLPVPPGFCVTIDAYREANGRLTDSIKSAIIDAYRRLGGVVAVRSSATSEDGAEASFAGQQETILGVEGESALLDAVQRCWDSLHTDRAKAYRRRQGIDEKEAAMGVVVQRLVPADVAGVLFTRDPLDATGERMLIEASWGLGESVVSGRVTPDRYQVERETGKCIERHLGVKSEKVVLGRVESVSEADQQKFCLDDGMLIALAELGRKVEAFYGDARDIEWAVADGTVWLLQARPITTVTAWDREKFRRGEVLRLQSLMEDPAKTVWVRYNVAEILPEPTPMTWAIIQQMLGPTGGMGMMNRDFGASPDDSLGQRGVYDLILGRPYVNLARMPRMQSRNPPFEYPVEDFKKSPSLALDPKPTKPSFLAMLARPISSWRLMRCMMRTQSLAATFPERFRKEIMPTFVAEVDEAVGRDISSMSVESLVQELDHWVRRTLIGFARESLKPTVFADSSWQILFEALKNPLGEERARSALGEITAGAKADAGADLPTALREVAAGRMSREAFLAGFGHRGSHEMELAAPRWSEDHSALDRMLEMSRPEAEPSDNWESRWERVADEAKFGSVMRPFWKKHADATRTFLGLRETGKHYLMRGYALIRRILLEIDAKLELGGEVFYWLPEEFVSDRGRLKSPSERKKERQIALSLEMPAVIFGDDLDAIGRPSPLPEGNHLQGVPLSAGVAEAFALVLTEPTADIPNDGYVLVCPSTDPAWVPLFARAKALVMETGGVLSHGAIVAREFQLPAVAGIPGVVRRLKTGDRLRVDGGRGTVVVIH